MRLHTLATKRKAVGHRLHVGRHLELSWNGVSVGRLEPGEAGKVIPIFRSTRQSIATKKRMYRTSANPPRRRAGGKFVSSSQGRRRVRASQIWGIAPTGCQEEEHISLFADIYAVLLSGLLGNRLRNPPRNPKNNFARTRAESSSRKKFIFVDRGAILRPPSRFVLKLHLCTNCTGAQRIGCLQYYGYGLCLRFGNGRLSDDVYVKRQSRISLLLFFS